MLRNGLTETESIDQANAKLYRKIVFIPEMEIDGYYTGQVFYPDNKRQGLMDFSVASFISAILLQEDDSALGT